MWSKKKNYSKWFNKCLSMSATSLDVSYKCAVFERKLWFCFSDCRWSLNDTSFIQCFRCLYLGSAVASYGIWCPTPWQSCQYWLQRCMYHWDESPHGLHNLKERKKKKTFNKWGLCSSFYSTSNSNSRSSIELRQSHCSKTLLGNTHRWNFWVGISFSTI